MKIFGNRAELQSELKNMRFVILEKKKKLVKHIFKDIFKYRKKELFGDNLYQCTVLQN